jgi:glycosyltransferase involved in cell wall biosynthesis
LRFIVLINGWSGNVISGGDYHILRVIKEWSNSHSISLVIPYIGLIACKPLLSPSYEIHLSSSDNNSIYSFKTISAYFKRILKTIAFNFKERPDVIVCSSHLLYDTFPGIVLKLRFRTRLVVYVHHIIGKNVEQRRGLLSKISILNEKISLYFIRSANIIFVVNEEVKENLKKIGIDSNRIIVSANGLDYKAIESVWSVSNTKFDGCFCGRLVKTKGVYDLIDIWKIVSDYFPNSKLVIIGDGPEYINLRNRIKQLGLEKNICLTGFLSENEKLLTIQSSKVFIFPSYEEGWGIAVAEAITCGLPVILYDIGAYNAFERYIIKVQKGNTKRMSEVIIQVLEKSTSKVGDRKLVRIKSIADWKDIANKELESVVSLEKCKR